MRFAASVRLSEATTNPAEKQPTPRSPCDSTRQAVATFAALQIVSNAGCSDEIMSIRLLSSLLDFGLRCVRFAVADVLTDRRRQQDRLLTDVPDLLALQHSIIISAGAGR